MTDEELIAEDRRIGQLLLGLPGALERYAGGLLKESADRLEDRATEADDDWP